MSRKRHFVSTFKQSCIRLTLSIAPSMFGRELVEQVRADAKDTDRQVPVIVEKCIDAVEALALDYEGIYRKTGGSGQQRAITQLFERGDYDSFDLLDSDKFNDICSVTSVLKTYFRSLPIPLLTFDLYDQFIQAMSIREPAAKHQTLIELVNQLPAEHYFTLRKLSVHLHQ
jgi:Rho-type GTPase-activating protein 1/2